MGKILIIKNADFSASAIEQVTPIKPEDKTQILTQAEPFNFGTITGGGNYYPGSVVTLNAIPNTNYQFIYWNDNIKDSQRTITVGDEEMLYTAKFDISGTLLYQDMFSSGGYYEGGSWHESSQSNYYLLEINGTIHQGTKIKIFSDIFANAPVFVLDSNNNNLFRLGKYGSSNSKDNGRMSLINPDDRYN